MLQEETIKKITAVMQSLVKLNIFTQEEVDALQRVNESAIPMPCRENELPEKIPELFTLAETAKILRITLKGVYDLIKARKLEIIKLGKRTSRISADNIRELLCNGRICHASSGNSEEEKNEKAGFNNLQNSRKRINRK